MLKIDKRFDKFIKVFVGCVETYADLSIIILLPFFLMIPFFSNSIIFLHVLSLGIFRLTDIFIRLIFSTSKDLYL